ncbi:MAG: hypothetical protein WHT29_01625 [Bacteroidales bacterium]|nr:hypothetical protein [Bacteroidales bacterium]HOK99777.1 hypothetical protein [Bacteroidales bacterium]HPO66547.1 hypothetical protein [Bacteroidales bacterium]
MPFIRYVIGLEENILMTIDIEKYISNYSQTIRNFVKELLCFVTIIKANMTVKSSDIQYQCLNESFSSRFFHLNHYNCLEFITVKGTSERLAELTATLIDIQKSSENNEKLKRLKFFVIQ